jgi:hypothetical protein
VPDNGTRGIMPGAAASRHPQFPSSRAPPAATASRPGHSRLFVFINYIL